MKKTWIAAIALVTVASFMSGCAGVISPAIGTIYTDTKAPYTATGNSGYSKVGTSQCNSILGVVATGDASIKAAMDNGGITTIHHVDYETKGLLGIYATLTTTVYGE